MSGSSRPLAVILAGGAGTRLAPEVPLFEKPLHVVDGAPLICHALNFARAFGAELTVVVNPVIRSRVCELAPDARGVVQAEPTSALDAIRLGVRAWAHLDRPVLILCADNTFRPGGDWFREQVHRISNGYDGVVGTRLIADLVGRFSSFDPVTGKIVPKRRDDAVRPRWVGPILMPSGKWLIEALVLATTLEHALNLAGYPFKPIEMECVDHGVREP